jgi:hypothetical protein
LAVILINASISRVRLDAGDELLGKDARLLRRASHRAPREAARTPSVCRRRGGRAGRVDRSFAAFATSLRDDVSVSWR